MTPLNRYSLLAFVFALSFAVRFLITQSTPANDTWIDLTIYQDGGTLMVNGVNPYNAQDNVPLRETLREHRKTTNSWLAETPERWHYYTSGNLPLSMILYGAIEWVARGNPVMYRLAFSFIDSILAVMIMLFINRHWKVSGQTKALLAAGLGIFSPILLYVGTLYPEEKGLQILFMVGALYFSLDKKFIPAAFFLGCAIAFKGLGIFIAPLCLYYYLGSPKFSAWKEDGIFKKSIVFTLATALVAALPFVFYFPEVFKMMTSRLEASVGDIPTHASVWRWLYTWFPTYGKLLKILLTGFFIIINLYLVFRKKINPGMITASLLFWFVEITLTAGSLDRMNIGFLVIILLTGMFDSRAGKMLSAVYIFAGSILFFVGYYVVTKPVSYDAYDFEMADAAFSFQFFVIYLVILTTFLLDKNRSLA